MAIGKKQLIRLIRLVAQLKENRYPNCSSFAEELRNADLYDNENLSCSGKTVFRDIQVLKNDFAAPIRFDRKWNGYYLAHHGWTFACPNLLEETEMLSAVLGARIAEHIFPDPMKSKIRDSVDCLLAYNNPEFLDRTQINSLVIIPSNRTEVNPETFMPLFKAWQEHKVCRIDYLDSRGNSTERDFEPHSLIFYEGIWYTKGYCRTRKDNRTLVLPRMKSVHPTGETFETNPEIIRSSTEDLIFDAEMVQNAVIHCDEYLTKFISTRPLHPEQEITYNADGSSELRIKSIPKLRLLTWTMHQCGRAVITSPAACGRELLELCEKLLSKQKNINSK